MTRSLIDAGADVNHRDHYGYTALKIATRRGHTEIEEVLIEGGAEISFWKKFKRFFAECRKTGLNKKLDRF